MQKISGKSSMPSSDLWYNDAVRVYSFTPVTSVTLVSHLAGIRASSNS